MSLPAPPWQRTPRRPGRQPLSQQAIVDAALAILDRDGLDAVTMRAVAQELNTGAASLYAHVSNKDELAELMLDRVMGEITVPDPDPDCWQDQVRALARQTVGVLTGHPGIARIALETLIPVGPNALAGTERMLAILRAGGLPDRVVALAIDLFATFTTAVALERSQWIAAQRAGGDVARRLAQTNDYLSALPADRFPHLLAMQAASRELGGEERFEFGLDVLVAGITALAGAESGGTVQSC
jgi:AcrR family transcriptional regulator